MGDVDSSACLTGSNVMNTLGISYSALDSERFGFRVYRGNYDNFETKVIAHDIFNSACDIAIIRVPSAFSAKISSLARWALPVTHADTLVHYSCDLRKYNPVPFTNSDLEFTAARPGDVNDLHKIVRTVFSNYRSHYHANPFFPEDKILAGYQQWAEQFIYANGCVWLVRRAGQLIGFAANSSDNDARIATGVLYGVEPAASGGGIYTDMIRYTQSEAKRAGMRTMEVSTQLTNHAVQKIWVREGFAIQKTEDTYHVNALLTGGETLVERPICFKAEAVARFAEVTGDTNPIHLSADAAQVMGFSDRVVHGVMATAEFSRILGTEIPGAGTLLGNLHLAFIRPLFINTNYTLRIKIPIDLNSAGPNRVVMTISGDSQVPNLYAQGDIFLNRRFKQS